MLFLFLIIVSESLVVSYSKVNESPDEFLIHDPIALLGQS